jgi:hypothetical protein
MAHGTGDSTHTAAGEGAGVGAVGGGGAGGGESADTGRVATGRFAAARNALTRNPLARGRSEAVGERRGPEDDAERQARVARALRAAQGDEAAAGETDWRAVSIFGAGLTIGALLGAGVALLLAPASGFETRMRLVRSARRTRERLRKGARKGTRDLKRGVSRKLTLGRWAAEDAWERRRRRSRYDD